MQAVYATCSSNHHKPSCIQLHPDPKHLASCSPPHAAPTCQRLPCHLCHVCQQPSTTIRPYTVWIASLPCVHTPLDRQLHASDTKGVQQEQKEPRRAHLPPLLSLRRGRLRLRKSRGPPQLAVVRAFHIGPSVCSSPLVGAVHTLMRPELPCDAEAQSGPSRRLCSLSRKNKDFTCAMLIWRCNTS